MSSSRIGAALCFAASSRATSVRVNADRSQTAVWSGTTKSSARIRGGMMPEKAVLRSLCSRASRTAGFGGEERSLASA